MLWIAPVEPPTWGSYPVEAPVVGDAMTGDAQVLLDVTHLEADLSHREMILHRRVGLLLALVNGMVEDGGMFF